MPKGMPKKFSELKTKPSGPKEHIGEAGLILGERTDESDEDTFDSQDIQQHWKRQEK